MTLSDTKLRNLKPGEKSYAETDEGGLHIEVMPGGAKVWRLRYRVGGRDSKRDALIYSQIDGSKRPCVCENRRIES